ncbi:putative leucine-rich repeat receptor-like serine/threonine-protein kinase [Senna tora]|uniref:Putative leucine-rich repeat receptor-like serine/threonine-protein kinase n=1 Tax=Senna tora TaxID=362788 RepID=A0A834TK62_9FABA|nr:putative leucine-rich repeat receptor-like serine/threonine-protein kinase [Senna tora]
MLKEKGKLMELVDKRLGSEFDEEEVMVMMKVALLCTNVSSALRPSMSSVVSMLEGRMSVHDIVLESSEVLDEKKMEAMRKHYYYSEIEENNVVEMQKLNSSEDGPWTASSTSAADLYPVNLDSSYWEKRD